MKCHFIQLSDLHCASSADEYPVKNNQAVAAIKSIGKFDSIILFFFGDFTNEAAPNEFKAAKSVIGRFISRIAPLENNVRIPVMIVPENHDMVLSKDECLLNELDKLNSFFDYAVSKDCFREHKLFDKKLIDLRGVKVQLCLLNSAPFSTRCPGDKQLRYLPPFFADKLVQDTDVDIKITVMHHHSEWREWYTKEMIHEAITSDDITFFGHDHKAEFLIAQYADGNSYNIIMGGEINLDQQSSSSFNAVVYDSETELFERYSLTWSPEKHIFHPQSYGTFSIRRNHLMPTDGYFDKINKDSQGISEHFTEIDYSRF